MKTLCQLIGAIFLFMIGFKVLLVLCSLLASVFKYVLAIAIFITIARYFIKKSK